MCFEEVKRVRGVSQGPWVWGRGEAMRISGGPSLGKVVVGVRGKVGGRG